MYTHHEGINSEFHRLSDSACYCIRQFFQSSWIKSCNSYNSLIPPLISSTALILFDISIFGNASKAAFYFTSVYRYLEFTMSKELSKKDCLIARSLGVLTSHMHSPKLPKFGFYCILFFFFDNHI